MWYRDNDCKISGQRRGIVQPPRSALLFCLPERSSNRAELCPSVAVSRGTVIKMSASLAG
jgi:hypothetical protein